jgi:hypothetical protein
VYGLPKGVSVIVLEKGVEVKSESIDSDGETKFELEKGRLYEIWISKAGFLSHVLHNVHAEGKGKFNITLYKETKKIQSNKKQFVGIGREFVDVKKMTIPAEYLAEGVLLTKEDDLSKGEIVNMKTVAKVAKGQKKAQSKIDKLKKQRASLEDKITDEEASIGAGEKSKMDGDEAVLKLQKSIVKINDKLKNLAY